MFRPEKSKEDEMTYKEILHHCESTSTCHGICHAGNALNEKSKLFWRILFLICFTLLVMQMCWLSQKYMKYEKTVDLDVSLMYPSRHF